MDDIFTRMPNPFFIKPRMLHPRLARLFKHCNSKTIVGRLNCYGAAVRPRLRGYYHYPQPGHFSQGFRKLAFKFDLERALSERLYLRYMTLADGHIPITQEQAEKASVRNHVFAGVIKGGAYHFYFRSKHEHDGRLAWLHKSGANDLVHHDYLQEVITDIGLALQQYIGDHAPLNNTHANDGVIGYFKFPKQRVSREQTTPPQYSTRAVQEMAKIFHAYMDARLNKGPAHSSRLSEADVIISELRYTQPEKIPKVRLMLDMIKALGTQPQMFRPIARSFDALTEEISALGLTQHPEMKSMMARIEANKPRARAALKPSQPQQRRRHAAAPQRQALKA